MSDEANSSRVEDILKNINGESHELEKPRSRVEEIFTNILNGSLIFGKAQSRVEDLLIELADIIESGDGGSLADLDNIAFGNNPTVPEEGKITSENLEDIADAINEVSSRPVISIGELEEHINTNGEYEAPSGAAWNKVVVDVEAEPSLIPLTVTENGTYTPDEGYDGFDTVDVDVEPSLILLTVTENGTYTPDEGYDGFDEVTVDVEAAVPNPNLDSLYVTENGTYTPDGVYDGFDEVTVDVKAAPSLTPLTVTENGTYTPDEGYDGFDEVTVNVENGFNDSVTFSGTMASPFANTPYSFLEMWYGLQQLWTNINVRPFMFLDATALGMGTGFVTLFYEIRNNVDCIVGYGGQADQSSSAAFTVVWDDTGLASAYVEQNGTITDLSSYASSINTIVYVPVKG